MTAVIPTRTPAATDLALRRLDLTGEHGLEALRPPARKAAR
jgi:hypothetical protein